MSGGSLLSVTPALGTSRPSSGLHGHFHSCITSPVHTDLYIRKNKISFLINKCSPCLEFCDNSTTYKHHYCFRNTNTFYTCMCLEFDFLADSKLKTRINKNSIFKQGQQELRECMWQGWVNIQCWGSPLWPWLTNFLSFPFSHVAHQDMNPHVYYHVSKRVN